VAHWSHPRSGIGGPAVGKHLRIHPVAGMYGLYRDPQIGWWGPPQTGLSDQFMDAEDGHGFLLECVQYAPGLTAASLPWQNGRQHKEDMLRFRKAATLVAIVRDHGGGSVEIDGGGEAVHRYAIADELDQRNFRRGLEALAQVLAASGAEEVHSLNSTPLR
jgi:hypothetical protein